MPRCLTPAERLSFSCGRHQLKRSNLILQGTFKVDSPNSLSDLSTGWTQHQASVKGTGISRHLIDALIPLYCQSGSKVLLSAHVSTSIPWISHINQSTNSNKLPLNQNCKIFLCEIINRFAPSPLQPPNWPIQLIVCLNLSIFQLIDL